MINQSSNNHVQHYSTYKEKNAGYNKQNGGQHFELVELWIWQEIVTSYDKHYRTCIRTYPLYGMHLILTHLEEKDLIIHCCVRSLGWIRKRGIRYGVLVDVHRGISSAHSCS